MLAWLKGFPIGHYIIMAAVGVAVYMYSDLTLTKQALENQRELTEQWQTATEILVDTNKRETVIIHAGQEAERNIQEAPNADTPVPSDIAMPWAAGIDSVRDAGAKPADAEHDLSGPSSREAERTGPDTLGTSTIFNRSGAVFLEV